MSSIIPGVTGQKFTKFLHDVAPLLMRTSRQWYCTSFWNTLQIMQMISVGVHYFLPTLIGCHGNDPWQIRKRHPDWSSACNVLSYSKKTVKSVQHILRYLAGYANFCCVVPKVLKWALSTLELLDQSSKKCYDIEASLTLLMRTLIYRYSIPFQNARATNDGSLWFFHKIGCHSNVPWGIGKKGPDRSPICYMICTHII